MASSRGTRGSSRGRGAARGGAFDPRPSHRSFPRTARVNEVMREVIAEELERIDDDRLQLVTVTGITVDPDFHHATVWVSALTHAGGVNDVTEALAEHRVRLQQAVGRQVRLKRTPLLQFESDPAITNGQRIESILRTLPRPADDPASDPASYVSDADDATAEDTHDPRSDTDA